MSHKILIFGSSGMLGTYVSKYLKEQGHKVINSNREDLDLTDVNEKLLESLLRNVDYAINCAGVIIPRIESQGDVNTLLVNSIFPRILANACKITKTKCFHISTDGVFDGKVGNYNEQSAISINPNDFYGYTKFMGESLNCATMRVCPIGEEKGESRSLLEWIKSCKNGKANGFTNHIWNGLTSLQVGKVISQLIDKEIYWEGIRHIYSPTSVSKAELLHIVDEVYELSIDITSIKGETSVNRSLSSEYDLGLEIPEIKQQIKELKGYL